MATWLSWLLKEQDRNLLLRASNPCTSSRMLLETNFFKMLGYGYPISWRCWFFLFCLCWLPQCDLKMYYYHTSFLYYRLKFDMFASLHYIHVHLGYDYRLMCLVHRLLSLPMLVCMFERNFSVHFDEFLNVWCCLFLIFKWRFQCETLQNFVLEKHFYLHMVYENLISLYK